MGMKGSKHFAQELTMNDTPGSRLIYMSPIISALFLGHVYMNCIPPVADRHGCRY